MEVINLKTKYIGELEIVFREKNASNQILKELRVLEFYFNEIMSLIPLGQYNIESVMYNYFKGQGWNDAEWECKRVQEFYDQLSEIDSDISLETIETFNAIKLICSSTLVHSNRLFMELI